MYSILNFITWNPNPEVFTLGGFTLHYYSLFWAIGLALAYLIVRYLYRDQSIQEKLFEPLFIYCFFGILIGARLGHCLFYEPGYFLSHPLEIILPVKFTDSGMQFTGYQGLASHGGTLGLMISLWLYVRKTKLNFIHVLDNIAIATPITACMIRLGNLMNSEIVGKVTDVPWAFIFPREGMEPRHPSQLYEAIAYLVIFIAGWFLYKKYKNKLHRGFYFGYCLTTIFTFRFFIEFVKEIQVGFEQNMALDMGQWLSIPFVILGVACMIGGKWLEKLSTKEGNVYISQKKK